MMSLHIDDPAGPAAGAPAGRLTAREVEILSRIAAGESNKHIARAFGLSPHTVKRHVANILDKLDVSSRVQAAVWYAGSGPAGGASAPAASLQT